MGENADNALTVEARATIAGMQTRRLMSGRGASLYISRSSPYRALRYWLKNGRWAATEGPAPRCKGTGLDAAIQWLGEGTHAD